MRDIRHTRVRAGGVSRTVLLPGREGGPIRRDRGTDLNVTFYGVRGSTPCASDELRRYGGNTACVVVDAHGQDPIVLDLGTGLRSYGLDWSSDPDAGPFRGTALVTHLHWDHVQGIPFFGPILNEGAHLDLYAPVQADGPLEAVVRGFLAPPYFPVDIDALPGRITFHETAPGEFRVGAAEVRSEWVPHCGPTLGYRVAIDGRSVAYVSDHQQPGVGSTDVDPAVVDLCSDVDVLIHDAQFDLDEFAARIDWGHCTTDYAVEVAARSGAGTLVLFHHDPLHTDERVDALLDRARVRAGARGGIEVIAAYEGLSIDLPAQSDRSVVAPASTSGAVGAAGRDRSSVLSTATGGGSSPAAPAR